MTRLPGRRRVATAALGAAVGLSVLAGCSSGGDDDNNTVSADTRTLTVFAAASLTSAFTELAEDFEEAKEKLSNVAYPITSKLYSGGEGGAGAGDDEPVDHDEL